MKLSFSFAILASLLFSGCKKNGSEIPEFISFPGALDSIASYQTTDSISVYSELTAVRFYYDSKKRVKKITFPSGPNLDVRFFGFFEYNGDNQLPYLYIDSMSENLTFPHIVKNYFSFDNASRLVTDSVADYYRNPDITSFRSYIRNFKYSNNYYISSDSRYTICANKDTNFLNSVGDIAKIKRTCSGVTLQTVDTYSADINPLSELNIHPVLFKLRSTPFAHAIQNIIFNLYEPKYMYKKTSGTNDVFYRNNKDDWNLVLFTTEKDAQNRIYKLIISNYTYSRNVSGGWYLYSKFFSGYKFYYHP